eukprot:TRINITY_DN22714_c0_g1_i1.p1 TRINITY_DN22714_c0_g1~~TRINITY_DN22714_c0_g1_i1.p1  ORF type:complete len:243 (-),score=28.36 TRINITY_DN22714_c0_g1_i1:57-785(-)
MFSICFASLLAVLVTRHAAEKKGRAPTLGPGDGRKRNWPSIVEHIDVQWQTRHEDCVRSSSSDGDVIRFNHKGYIHEVGKGSPVEMKGQRLVAGMQIDANENSEPLEVKLGQHGLIVGMEAVLRTMCIGEQVRATIPGPLAYNSRPGFLPYDTSVTYEMEVVSIEQGDPVVEGADAKSSTGDAQTDRHVDPVPGVGSTLGAVLLVLMVVIFGGGAYLLSSRSSDGQPRKKGKESKKDAKKKR